MLIQFNFFYLLSWETTTLYATIWYNQMRRRQHFSIPMSNFLENLLISGDFHHLICRMEMSVTVCVMEIFCFRSFTEIWASLLNVNWNFNYSYFNCHSRVISASTLTSLLQWYYEHYMIFQRVKRNFSRTHKNRFQLFHLLMNTPKLISWSVHHVIRSTTN